MNAGLRTYKQASCRIAVPDGLPEDMQLQIREVLGVASESKRGGEATALMHQITTEADFAYIVLFLQVRPFEDGMTEEQLIKFYSKFGFSIVQTEPVLLMSRPPHKPKLARTH